MSNLKHYLLNNFDELEQLATSINAYNGALEHLMVLENDEEFFNTWFYNKPMEAVRSALYGNYNYTDDFVKFDGYMNLTSLNETDYKWLLENSVDEVIEELYKVKDECNWIDEKIIKLANKEIEEA